MATLGSSTDGKAIVGIDPVSERAEMVRAPSVDATLVQSPPLARTRAHLEGHVYLFIYRVRHGYDAYAERIAINCVHQHGWRILKTDTATAFATDRFTGVGTDAAHVANLADFGVSFKLNH